MTREDAISIMNVIVHMLEEKYDTDRVEEAVDMAIKALEQQPNIDMDSEEIKILQKRSYLEGFHEALKMSVKQEPCEDAISREQLVRELNAQMAVDAISREVALDMLEHLPSIQPKPKIDFEHKAEIVISQLRADRDRLQDAIDKIRAEIIEACGYSKDYVGTFDYTTTYLKIVLQIIDKYKAESEE